MCAERTLSARGFGGRVISGLNKLSVSYTVPVAIVTVSLLILCIAVLQLWLLESYELKNVPDSVSWTYSQTQAEALRLMATVGEYRSGRADLQQFQHQYDLLISRLNVLADGPATRHLASMGFADEMIPLDAAIRARDPVERNLSEADLAALADQLGVLERLMNRVTNLSSHSYWTGVLNAVDAYRRTTFLSIMMMLAAIFGVILIGARLMLAQREVIAAESLERDLQRERETADYFRNIAAVIAHQFRTPLAVIDSTAQRALRDPKLAEIPELSTSVHKVRRNVRRMLYFSDQALLAGSVETGNLSPRLQSVALSDLLLRIIGQEGFGPQRGRLSLRIGDRSVRARCDPNFCFHSTYNLIENALKYAPGNSRVRISHRQEEGWAVIEVSDEGPGIPLDEQDLIFQRFWRGSTATDRPGTGIGLWLSRRLAELQGGHLTVHSDGRNGARFELRLPSADSHPMRRKRGQ